MNSRFYWIWTVEGLLEWVSKRFGLIRTWNVDSVKAGDKLQLQMVQEEAQLQATYRTQEIACTYY
jgi:hypothetical protein